MIVRQLDLNDARVAQHQAGAHGGPEEAQRQGARTVKRQRLVLVVLLRGERTRCGVRRGGRHDERGGAGHVNAQHKHVAAVVRDARKLADARERAFREQVWHKGQRLRLHARGPHAERRRKAVPSGLDLEREEAAEALVGLLAEAPVGLHVLRALGREGREQAETVRAERALAGLEHCAVVERAGLAGGKVNEAQLLGGTHAHVEDVAHVERVVEQVQVRAETVVEEDARGGLALEVLAELPRLAAHGHAAVGVERRHRRLVELRVQHEDEQRLGLPAHVALMHDCGVAAGSVDSPLVGVEALRDDEPQHVHAEHGLDAARVVHLRLHVEHAAEAEA